MVKQITNDALTLCNTNSSSGGVKYKELQHLMKKTTIATQDVMMFVKLRKVSIGTNEVESVAAKLVQAKLAKEGVGRRYGSGGVLPLCWRDITVVNKFLNIID